MTIYICIEAVLLVLLFKKKPHHIGYSFISIGLLLISAFRAESVGTDVVNYIIEYNLHGIETWKESFTNSEYTFAIYCKFLNVLGLKERGFLIATAILFAMLLMIALHVNHCDKILTFSLFYFAGLYLQSFCIIRQSLAIVTALISYSSLEKNYSIQMPYNKGRFQRFPIGFVIGMIIAIGFHPTVIVLFALPVMMLFYGQKRCRKPSVFLRDGILCMSAALIILPVLYPFILQHSKEKYQVLYGGSYVTGPFGNWKSGILLVALYLIFYIAYYNNWKKLTEKENIIVGSVIMLAFACSSLSIINSTLGRTNLFFEGLMVLMLGKLLSHRYTRIKSINFYVILVFSAFFILYLMRDSIVVVPYKIWQ